MVKYNYSILSLCLFLCCIYAHAQDTLKVPFTVFKGDTIPVMEINTIEVSKSRGEFKEQDYKRFTRLYYNVNKVWPYVKEVSKRLKEVDEKLNTITDNRTRKIFLKQYEKTLKEEFAGDIKNLSVNQGKILMKLIYRETNKTTFDLIKLYRGGFEAAMWQGIAGVFGSTLKLDYNPEEDKDIEEIVRLLEGY